MEKSGTSFNAASNGIVEGLATMAAPVSERQTTHIAELMQRLGIESIVPQLNLVYAAALQQCEACRSKQACREWLDSMPQLLVSAPDFCPNSEILFELRANQLGHAVTSNNLAYIADLERFEDEIDDLLLQSRRATRCWPNSGCARRVCRMKSNGFATTPAAKGSPINV